MKKTFKQLVLLLTSAIAVSCSSDEDIFGTENLSNAERRIAVIAEDFTPTDGTRTAYTENGNGYSFAWTEGDALGIFPENGFQTIFPLGDGDGVGSNTAVFDGGKWALRPNESYAAYYPLVEKVSLDYKAIPIDYTGQVQDGNGSTSHLSAYDFMASSFNGVDAKGNVNFILQHLGCLVQFVLTMPDVDTYSSMEIESSDTPFIVSGTYSISDANHTLKNKNTSNKITIGLNNVSTSADDKVLIITAMFAPVDLSASSLTLTVIGNNKEYTVVVPGQNLFNGMASNLENEDQFHAFIPYVTFSAAEAQTLSMSIPVDQLEYSVNDGEWQLLGTETVPFGGDKGDLRLRGSNEYGTSIFYRFNHDYDNSTIQFGTNAEVACSGDIRTLADYKNYRKENTSDDRFLYLFRGCTALTSAPKLPAKTLASSCYEGMFEGCSSLTSAPELPATTLANSCYSEMFYGCTSLTTAPELPAITLASECYSYMFSGCTSLTQAPELPAETLAEFCYSEMFSRCSSLTSAPELPATTLANCCYSNMFSSCTSLTSAPELSAETLATNCYSGMFSVCTSLISAPELPAKTLTGSCYRIMFYGCTSLKTAPELPAETLARGCYSQMFSGCTSLTSAPELFAETLAVSCYSGMFSRCTSLTQTPKLPATTLANNCYSEMFSDCSSLATAPELPATSLASGCYSGMFSRCTSLTNAPELPAETLTESCYRYMFVYCTSLSCIKMMATDISASSCLSDWIYGVAETGTFVKNSAATWDNEGVVPNGWTVKTATE